MVGDSSDENPYAAPGVQMVEPEAAHSGSKPISRLMLFYQYFVASIAFFICCSFFGLLLTLFLPPEFLDTVAASPIHLCTTGIAFLLARHHFRRSLARLSTDE